MARLKKTTTKTAIKAAVKPAAKKRTAKRASKKAQPKTGVVLKEQGRFFLSIGDQKYDMASMVIDPAELETLERGDAPGFFDHAVQLRGHHRHMGDAVFLEPARV